MLLLPRQKRDQRPQVKIVVGPTGGMLSQRLDGTLPRKQVAEKETIVVNEPPGEAVQRAAKPDADRDLKPLLGTVMQGGRQLGAKGLDQQVFLPPAVELPLPGHGEDR